VIPYRSFLAEAKNFLDFTATPKARSCIRCFVGIEAMQYVVGLGNLANDLVKGFINTLTAVVSD